ncbi:MAG: TetR/AcrR family transcriptional regulator [Arthrobacter sp.]|uniref:TetR/AcrR family transcriptional regulator n=1 Tax=Arthrobacter sp. TaxID=1667 RepID=UPI0034896354
MQEKINRILHAAERLLATYGVDGIRLKDIAAEAGVSIGLIQHHFGSRDAVVREMLVSASRRRLANWTAQLDGVEDSQTRLRLLLAGALSSRERCILWTESCAAASRHDFLQPLVSQTNDEWRRWVLETLERGRVDGTFNLHASAPDTARILVALVDGLMVAVAADDAGTSTESASTLLLMAAAPHVGLDVL